MCLLVFAWDCHPRYRLVLAGNRDEFHARPARPAQWWNEPAMLAGRDEEAGGTWLGVDRKGRFGVVTNFREMAPREQGLRSRGQLITGYIGAGEDFRARLASDTGRYSGYNLILGELADGPLHYHSNRGPSREIEPGLHGLSNHLLDTPWPKLARALARLQGLTAKPTIDDDSLLDLLADRQQASPQELPDTGIGPELERLLSSAFIVSPAYGTRCSTVVLLDRANQLQFVERRFAADGSVAGESRFDFSLE